MNLAPLLRPRSASLRSLLPFALAVCITVAGCGTLAVTEMPAPNLTEKPIPAKLGVQITGDSLKKAFSEPDRRKLGLASGQYFSEVVLLPPETRYIAPQDVFDQFGVDVILQMQITDTKTSADMNAIFIPGMLLLFAEPLAPIMSYEITLSMETNLRDARSGRLLWAKTEPTHASDHFSPVGPEEKIAELAQRGLHHAVVNVFETLRKELAAYKPGAVVKPLAKIVKAAPSASVAPKANRYAVVVGVEQYREQLPKADFAVDDAKAMANFLTKSAGYREENVIVRLNEQATKSDMEKYFEGWLKNNVDASSSLIIYFSGHGAPQVTTGDAYLVPYDGDPAFIEQTGYSLKRLYQTLEKLPTKNIVVMLDSCFSGAGSRSVLAKGAKPMILTVEGLSDNGTKTVVLSATSGSHISVADQENKQGLFTHYALQGMAGDADANGDGEIDVRELFEYLKPQVQRVARKTYNTEQVPQLIIPPALVSKAPLKVVERN